MNFIKKVIGFIVDFTIGPVLRLKDIRTMSVVETVVNAVSIAARGVVVASFFTAVPAFIVKLALVWIFGAYILAAIVMAFSLVGLMAFFGYAAASAVVKESGDEQVAAGATPAMA